MHKMILGAALLAATLPLQLLVHTSARAANDKPNIDRIANEGVLFTDY